MNLTDELLLIFARLNGQTIRLMMLRKLLSTAHKEHVVRNAIYELERANKIERIKVPKQEGLCYKILTKSDC